jgi:phosphatidylglycerol lysyltransferase
VSITALPIPRRPPPPREDGPAPPVPEPPPVRTLRWPRWLAPAASVLVFAFVAAVLHRALQEYRLADVLAALATIPAPSLASAALATVLGYALLTLYDALGVRYVGKPVPYSRTALTSFVAYAFGHNVSLASFTGAAVRYRIYSTQGYTALDVATVVSFCALTTFVGLGLVGGTALLAAAPGTTALHLGHAWSQLFGVLLLAAVTAYLGWAGLARWPITVGAWTLRSPGWRLALAQAVLAVVELCTAATVLWSLLPPDAGIDPATFAGVYAIAVVGGMVSQVPGGLGVFEAILVYALPHVPAPRLFAALIAYRGLYYFAPLVVAAVALAGHEAWRQRHRLGTARGLAARFVAPVLVPVAPQLIGVLVFVAGAVLLVSGATPTLDARLAWLRHALPLPLVEVAHLAGSVVGVGLLVLSRGLFRRLDAAFRFTSWLLAAGIAASLLKGLDVEEAAFLALVLLIVRMARAAFYRRASPLAERLTPGWLASVAIVVGLSIWIGLVAYRSVPYSHDLWWTFASRADAPRMLRASLAVVVALGWFVAAQMLRPARPAPHVPEALDVERVKRTLQHAEASLANAALAGDKRLHWHPAGDAFVMYQVQGDSWIALGDPVGPPERREELVWSFRELADRSGGRTAFYQVGPRALPMYVDLGLSLVKLGEEARVDLRTFGLDGSARADLRQARRRAERDGATFEVIPPGRVRPLLPRLRAISDAWLEDKATAEKRFSLGAYSDEYVQQFPIAVVRSEGVIGAFANLWTTGTKEELSVDLMRFGPDAPRGAMDYLFVELMLWGRAQGYRWMNLGMAPLAGLENRALAPAWHRMGSLVYRHGEQFYNFDGLRRYKQKFDPVWEPRYLASPGGLRLPAVLYDVSTLISGGLRELVAR